MGVLRTQAAFPLGCLLRQESVFEIENADSTHEFLRWLRPVEFHADACVHAKLPDTGYTSPSTCVGKTILYAQKDTTASARFVDWAEQRSADRIWPRIADIPRTGTAITSGQPVTTLLVEAESAAELERREQQLGAELRRALESS